MSACLHDLTQFVVGTWSLVFGYLVMFWVMCGRGLLFCRAIQSRVRVPGDFIDKLYGCSGQSYSGVWGVQVIPVVGEYEVVVVPGWGTLHVVGSQNPGARSGEVRFWFPFPDLGCLGLRCPIRVMGAPGWG